MVDDHIPGTTTVRRWFWPARSWTAQGLGIGVVQDTRR